MPFIFRPILTRASFHSIHHNTTGSRILYVLQVPGNTADQMLCQGLLLIQEYVLKACINSADGYGKDEYETNEKGNNGKDHQAYINKSEDKQ